MLLDPLHLVRRTGASVPRKLAPQTEIREAELEVIEQIYPHRLRLIASGVFFPNVVDLTSPLFPDVMATFVPFHDLQFKHMFLLISSNEKFVHLHGATTTIECRVITPSNKRCLIVPAQQRSCFHIRSQHRFFLSFTRDDVLPRIVNLSVSGLRRVWRVPLEYGLLHTTRGVSAAGEACLNQ